MRRGDGITVACTGASGFIGSRLLQTLLARGYTVRALQHRTPLPDHPNLIRITGSLIEAADRDALVHGADIVLHVGGLVLANRRADFFRVNCTATVALAHAALNAGCKKFLFTSSLAAREPQLSPYAASKRAAEQQLRAVEGLAYDILRPPAIYGPKDVNSLPLLNMLRRGHVWLPVRRKSTVAMLYVDDLVGAIIAWMESDQLPTGAIYELGDHKVGYEWPEIIASAEKILRQRISLHRLPIALAIGVACVAQSWAWLTRHPAFISIGKIREISHADWSADPTDFIAATGWMPEKTLQQGFALMLELSDEPS
ncbi:MAG: NAD(P)-dependent oxidoreductase [Rickettsiales bacterium]|nr:NAD(P)-dependent oxidoreductase [Rickettsiales bacterium]